MAQEASYLERMSIIIINFAMSLRLLMIAKELK